MGSERRRGQRFAVSGVTGLVHITFGAKLLSTTAEGFTVEATRQLRVGKRYVFAAASSGSAQAQRGGTVTSCRLVAFRPGTSGSTASVYEAVVLAEPDPRTKLAEVGDQLTVDAANPAIARVLSSTGALVETEVELLVGSSCRVELTLADRSFSTRACVVFLHEVGGDGPASAYHLGVEFHNTSTENSEVLSMFLATLTP
jgi:hypothetical protein